MDDLMLLERALEAPPRVELPSPKEPPAVEQLRAQAETIIRGGEEWLANVKRKIARARRHKLHRAHFGKAVWPTLEPVLTRAINSRESFVRQLDALLDQIANTDNEHALALGDFARLVGGHVIKEHRFLVDTYYMLKADADDADPETRGGKTPLSTPEDVRAYFKRTRAA